ncbi:hypothetical protein [Hutsoniella sourekii]|uniref:hypothetical protein n=1 Tax=Hutsoniella sourekii TaxID=87650 RepID=UPI000483977C|nr:hypothetical protein [Hutsoniella sourekii]
MKRVYKWLASMSILGLALSPVSHLVQAEELDSEAILEELEAANQDVEAMTGHGAVTVTIADSTADLLDVQTDLEFQFQPEPFALQLSGQIDGLAQDFVSEDSESSSEAEPIHFAGSATIVDNVAYLFDGTTWTVQDVSGEINEFQSRYEEAKDEAEANVAANRQLNAELSEITETDDAYVVSMKTDLDPDSLYERLNETVNFDQIIEDSLAQARELQDEPLSAEEEAAIKEAQEKGIKVAFAGIQQSEAVYDKESKKLKEMTMKFALSPDQLTDIMGADAEEFANLSVSVDFHLVIDQYGEDVVIQVPEGAPTFDASESDELTESAA